MKAATMDAFKKSLGLTSGSQQDHSGREISIEMRADPRTSREIQLSSESYQTSSRHPNSRNLPQAQDGDTLPKADLVDSSDMRNKLMSMWHSVKYGKTVFNLDSKISLSPGNSAVWLLGRCYRKDSRTEYQNRVNAAIQDFHEDFKTRIWFTYRRQFEEFPGTSMTTDCGWGCMIRSGQMILANALLLQQFGRNWIWSDEKPNQRCSTTEIQANRLHRSIIRLFGDSPYTDVSPLSIHNLVNIANKCLGKNPGDWFGPSTTAHLLKKAVEASKHEMLKNICIYVAKDCTVYIQDVVDASRQATLRRHQRRKSVQTPSNGARNCEEDFSILEHPSEYPGLLVTDSVCSEEGHLFSSVIDGVPYYEEAAKLNDHHLTDPDGFHVLSDGTENYSLSHKVDVDGEEWVTEDLSSASARPKNISSQSSVESSDDMRQNTNSIQNQDDLSQMSEWSPVLILIPLRLGTEKLNTDYVPCLKSFLASENCLGIIGGRPKHSLYFVGFQNESLIHLDPHLVQDNVDVFRHNFSFDTFHCSTPRKMSIHKMDPSCCIGFYCPSEESFQAWCKLSEAIAIPPGQPQGSAYPMFGISDGKSSAHMTNSNVNEVPDEMSISIRSDLGDEAVSEEFIFL